MQVHDTQVYTSLLNLRQAHAAQASPMAAEDAASQPASAAAAVKASDNTITGTTASNLSPRVVGQLMQISQQAAQTESASDASLPNGEQRHLERIANDPDYAAEQAEMLGMHGELMFVGKDPFPRNGAPNSEWQAFWQAHNSRMEQVNQVNQVNHERQELYQRLAGQGIPQAEIYAELLKFNANQPHSYDAVIGTSEASGVTYADWNGARLAYLEQAMT